MRRLPAIAALTAVLMLSGCSAPLSLTPYHPLAPTISDEDFGTVSVYAVQDDATLTPPAAGLTAEVWDTFVRVATPDFVAETVVEYQAGDAPESDTLAFVYQTRDPDFWVFAANLATSDDREELIATLIHEYAHIITLGSDEVDPYVKTCDIPKLDEGCPNPDSILRTFEQTFWSDFGEDAPTADNSDGSLRFYQQNKEHFVSSYAATNVVEDVAETFMTFVLEDEPAGSDSIVAEKLQFFWAQPDLVAIRERIRSEFADDLGLAD